MEEKYKEYSEYKDLNIPWLGKIPQSWNVFDGKRIFQNMRESALENDEQLAASQKYGVIPQSLMMKLNDAKVMLALKGTSSFRHVEKDDFVISLRSFEGGIEHSSYTGCVSPAYTVLRAIKSIEPSFYKYLFKSKPFVSVLQATTDSLRDGKSITFEQFGNISIILPTISEQNKIAGFLDHETKKIDSLIEKQKRLIELLKEKRQAVISHAVTKGLNPDAPMRPSGVEWLGDIPAHWQLTKLKFISSIFGRIGFRGYTVDDIVSEGEGAIVLSPSNVDENIFCLNKKSYLSWRKYYESPEIIVTKNDILLVKTGSTYGKSSIVKEVNEPMTINPQMALIKNSKLNPLYLSYLLNSHFIKALIIVSNTGSGMPTMTQENINNFSILSPPLEESIKITNFLSDRTAKLDGLISKAQSAITLMQERRTALISAAVTGKIDVRDWQASEQIQEQEEQAA